MNNTLILNKLKKYLKPENYLFSHHLNYHNNIDEALKITFNNPEKLVIVKENSFLATKLYECLRSFYNDDELVLYLPEESLRSEAIISSFENKANRLKALKDIIDNNPRLIITSPYGLTRHLPKKHSLNSLNIKLKVNDIIKRDTLINNLKQSGYELRFKTETPLCYSVRGSVLDVFSINYELPIRIEFFDDEIDSIRFYDIESQRTVKQVEAVELCFASDVIFNQDDIKIINDALRDKTSGEIEFALNEINNGSTSTTLYPYYAFLENDHLLDYATNYELYLSNEKAILDNLHFIFEENINYIQEMASEHKLPLRFSVMGEFQKEIKKVKNYTSIMFENPDVDFEVIDIPINPLKITLSSIAKDLGKYQIIFVLNENEIEDILDEMININLSYHLVDNEFTDDINIVIGNLFQGFEATKAKIKVYTAKELFNHQKFIGRYNKSYQEAIQLDSYDELEVGDYIVHNNHGIGQYMGIHTQNINGIKSDYLVIAYRGNDKLSIPLNQFSLVRKYLSKDGHVPKLSKLGSDEWQKTKNKAQENINEIAEQLIELYQLRSKKTGFKFQSDNHLQKQFEDEFTYELTTDQKQAIKEVKADMESERIMDRLICGDVGFGKTEIALRASMKAVLSNKQVSYLCPTTILSIQHYKTFKERFKNFAIRIELLNRYVLPHTQKQIIKDLKEGKVDIVIGTHRLLASEIKYKDLGLLIIDEEQRFGVSHKEKIKTIKNNIDVLSLSATPIPRTLQMSLVGIRSLSTLNKAPSNRYPVQTYVVEKNEGLIKEAIFKELGRQGQVFYLYNNTEKIYALAKKINKLVPDAKVGVVHGKMDREHIEDVMNEFYLNQINVLICTTIIETGIDIPNANTVIIENAQNFGLSQLYQIKGRVGRSDRIAYAYLLIPKLKQLNENGIKRLNAIKEFTGLGSGYKIAMRDLSIRGAGDLLGASQSGFINGVGFEMYLAMLNDTIKTKQGIITDNKAPKQNYHLNIESYIPETFSKNDYEKLDLYQQLEQIHSKDELYAYYLKIIDSFGRLPKSVEALMDKKKLELMIDFDYLHSFEKQGNQYLAKISEKYSNNIDGVKFFDYCIKISKDFQIKYQNKQIIISIIDAKDNLKKMIKILEYIDKAIKGE
ncbi:MAG: transcription-repair coupling factor [Erysipelotrichaceae bacterium]|nr:transcription-repair coupling factor [Erysipelotrichaceae bacterium]